VHIFRRRHNVEELPQADAVEHAFDLASQRARANPQRAPLGQRFYKMIDTLQRPKLPFADQLQRQALLLLDEFHQRPRVQLSLEDAIQLRHRATIIEADQLGIILLLRQQDAHRRGSFKIRLAVQRLAVDDHAVEIEQHRFDRGAHSSRTVAAASSCRNRNCTSTKKTAGRMSRVILVASKATRSFGSAVQAQLEISGRYRGAAIDDPPCGSISPSARQPVIIDAPMTARITNASFFITFSFAPFAGQQVDFTDPYTLICNATAVPNVATTSALLRAAACSTV
jgi:hypothetical protein